MDSSIDRLGAVLVLLVADSQHEPAQDTDASLRVREAASRLKDNVSPAEDLH